MISGRCGVIFWIIQMAKSLFQTVKSMKNRLK